MTDGDPEAIARAWLAEMEACVRTEDYARARAIFAADVVGFGSVSQRLVGLAALEREQWRHVWGKIRGFTFDTDHLTWGAAGEPPGLIWLACPWMSRRVQPDGTTSHRPGRMTAILARRGDRWLAVHTHHSLAPTA